MGEQECNTGLALALGGGGGGEFVFSSRWRDRDHDEDRKPPVQLHILFPIQTNQEDHKEEEVSTKQQMHITRSWNNNKESDTASGDTGDGRDMDGGTRKKLRLTKEQSALLEDSFREHNILSSNQKHELSQRLNLKPRQVEVWFQNRRARTKVKQTEVDCEFLKRCCESLSDENRRLKKELQELMAMRTAALPAVPFCVQLQKAAGRTVCPSCKRTAADAGKGPSMPC